MLGIENCHDSGRNVERQQEAELFGVMILVVRELGLLLLLLLLSQ